MVAAKGKLAVANTNTGKAKSFGKKSAFQSHNPPNNVLPKKPNSMVPSQGCDTSEKAKSRLQAEHEDSRGIRVSDASTNLDSCFSKTVDLGGPPSKSQRQASCFLTEEQWRKSFKRQDYSICEICIHRVRALWKRARDSQAWDGTEEAAKIETNKKHIQEVKQDCVNGLCRKWVRGGLETKNSHQGKRKVEPVGHPENDLDLVTTGTVEDLSTSWDNAGRQFLAMIREYKKRKAADNGKAEPEKSLTLGNEARADLPLPRPFGLIGKTNPNFFITDLGRLDRAKRLEGSIRRHAKSVQDGRPLKADADPTRDIAFQVESSIHKSAKCLDTYLEGLKLFVKTLEDMKGGLLYEVKDGKLASVRCRKALCQIWKEPQSTVEQAAPATKPTIDLTSGEQEPKMSPEIKKEHKRKASDNADSGNPKRSRAKPGSALAGHPKAKSLKERQNLKYCQPLTNLKKTQKSTGGRVYGF